MISNGIQRAWRLALICGAAVSLAGCGGADPKPRGIDSVLLVTLDTYRADYVSCYGSERVQTPALDALAARGARMTRAWTTVPLTTPAHASILTGLYPPGHGVRNNGRFRLPDSVTTLAEVLAPRGVDTAAFVSAFPTSRLFGLAQGFEHFDDDFGLDERGRKRSSRGGNETVLRAERWLRQREGQPFLAWVHLYDAHTPYTPPREFAQRYPRDPYAGEIAYDDALVGRLVDLLSELGLTERTAVVVLADHGEGLGTHGEEEHGLLLYEETVAIPFLIVAPGRIAPGTLVETPASVVDVLPTTCGLLGVPAPPGVQGRDLLAPGPAGEGAKQEPVSLYAETLYPHEEFGWSALYALRQGDLKYIAAPEPELYDLAEDPREHSSLTTDQPEQAQRLAAGLSRRAAEVVDTARLAAATGFGAGDDEETIARLESLGYVAGGGGSSDEGEALPAVGGRNPRDAVEDLFALHRAQEMLKAGMADQSARLLSKVLTRDPENPQILLKLALSEQMAGQVDKAERTYRRLIELHPRFFLGTMRLSRMLVDAGRLEEARLLWVRLKSLVPGYVAIPLRIAEIELLQGESEQAAQRLESLLDSRPDDVEAWGMLGKAREALGDADGALEAWRSGLQHSATEKTCVEGAVRLLRERGRLDEARILVEGLISRVPDEPFLRKLRDELGR